MLDASIFFSGLLEKKKEANMSDVVCGLMHLSLRVKNYERSLDFYCNGLGLEKMFEYTKQDLICIALSLDPGR